MGHTYDMWDSSYSKRRPAFVVAPFFSSLANARVALSADLTDLGLTGAWALPPLCVGRV